jgi:hypothetical protein
MGTFLGIIVETGERADFWSIAQGHRIEPLAALGEIVSPHVLVSCWDAGWPDWKAMPTVARELSRSLDGACLALGAQTSASVLDVHAFDRGIATRVLQHGDSAGWARVEGTAQPWEPALLFDEVEDFGLEAGRDWPHVLYDEISADDVERYRSARRDGDPGRVLDLLVPDHLNPIDRVCRYFGVDWQQPMGRWRPKSSLLSRWLRR